MIFMIPSLALDRQTLVMEHDIKLAIYNHIHIHIDLHIINILQFSNMNWVQYCDDTYM